MHAGLTAQLMCAHTAPLPRESVRALATSRPGVHDLAIVAALTQDRQLGAGHQNSYLQPLCQLVLLSEVHSPPRGQPQCRLLPLLLLQLLPRCQQLSNQVLEQAVAGYERGLLIAAQLQAVHHPAGALPGLQRGRDAQHSTARHSTWYSLSSRHIYS